MGIRKGVPCEGCGEVTIDLEHWNHFEIQHDVPQFGAFGQLIEHNLYCCSEGCVQTIINRIGTSCVRQPDDTLTVWPTDNAVKQHNEDNRKAGGWSGD